MDASVPASGFVSSCAFAARKLEEDKIGRHVVEERRKQPGEPEIGDFMRRSILLADHREQPGKRAAAPRMEHGQNRDDGDKDASEQLGDLSYRLPGKIVGLAMRFRRQPQ